MLIDPCELSPSYVRSIAPYQPGKPISELAREMGLDEAGIVKLASNENPRGIGPRTRAAIEAAIGGVARYPDGNGFELKQALSARYGVDPSSIVLGNGSNDVLELVALAFLGPGRAAVLSEHAFAVYPLATQARGARAIVVPAKNYGHDLETMAKAIDDETYVAWIANPNNPTGTLARPDEIEAFLRRVPERVIVVLDEAYNEYLTPDLRANSAKWIKRHPNLVITRTFSKAYGLAGLRVGFALAHSSVADVMNRVRQPFNVNSIALAAARAALDDMEFVARSYAENLQGLKQLEEGARRLGLDFIPSHANFLTLRVGKAVGDLQAPAAPERDRAAGGRRLRAARAPARHHRHAPGKRQVPRRARRQPEGMKLAVIGVGLIGGSFALALKQAKVASHVVGVGRNPANLKLALERGAIDSIAPDPAAAARGADLVLLATPVSHYPKILSSMSLHSTLVVTDAGSTKRDVIVAARSALKGKNCAVRPGASDRRRREERRRGCDAGAVQKQASRSDPAA